MQCCKKIHEYTQYFSSYEKNICLHLWCFWGRGFRNTHYFIFLPLAVTVSAKDFDCVTDFLVPWVSGSFLGRDAIKTIYKGILAKSGYNTKLKKWLQAVQKQ